MADRNPSTVIAHAAFKRVCDICNKSKDVLNFLPTPYSNIKTELVKHCEECRRRKRKWTFDPSMAEVPPSKRNSQHNSSNTDAQSADRCLSACEQLPHELIAHICNYVDKEDLPNLRQVCRLLQLNSIYAFGEAFLKPKRYIATEFSLKHLLSVVSHPIFGGFVDTISIGSTHIGGEVANPHNIRWKTTWNRAWKHEHEFLGDMSDDTPVMKLLTEICSKVGARGRPITLEVHHGGRWRGYGSEEMYSEVRQITTGPWGRDRYASLRALIRACILAGGCTLAGLTMDCDDTHPINYQSYSTLRTYAVEHLHVSPLGLEERISIQSECAVGRLCLNKHKKTLFMQNYWIRHADDAELHGAGTLHRLELRDTLIDQNALMRVLALCEQSLTTLILNNVKLTDEQNETPSWHTVFAWMTDSMMHLQYYEMRRVNAYRVGIDSKLYVAIQQPRVPARIFMGEGEVRAGLAELASVFAAQDGQFMLASNNPL